jgi:hypothetical protein
MDTEALKPILAGMVRHILTTAGGALVAGGYMQSSDQAAFIGGGMVVAGLIWSWWQKRGQAQVLAIVAKMHPVAPPSATTGQAAKAATDAAKAVASILLVAFVLSFLLASSSAHAQGLPNLFAKPAPKVKTKAPAAPAVDPLQKMMTDIENVQQAVVTGVVDDLNAADADAATLTNASDPTSFRDPIAHACYPAAVKFLQSLPAASAPTGKFIVAQLFQKKRDFQAQIQAGLPVYLKMGCAPLLGDEVTIFTKMMGLVGVTVSAGALTGLFPAVAPITLPALAL